MTYSTADLELYLPVYLKKDIATLVEGRKNNASLLDCFFCELQASINVAFYDKEITAAEADFLRQKYLWQEM